MMRDPSSIAIGIVLPVILILLFGYGLSLDVKNVPVAVVLEDPSPDATELAAGFQLSPYFAAQTYDFDAARTRTHAGAKGRCDCAHPTRFCRQLKSWTQRKCRSWFTGPMPTTPGSSRLMPKERWASGRRAERPREKSIGADP